MVSPLAPPAVPEPVRWVVDVVVHGAPYAGFAVSGDLWPQGDEAALFGLADAWERLAGAVAGALPELAGAAGRVSGAYGGDAGQEFLFAAQELLGSGSGVAALAQAARDRQLTVHMGALDIQLTKYMIIMKALVTAVAVLYALAVGYLTAGASTVSVPGLVQAGRAGVVRAAGRLLANLAGRGSGRLALGQALRAGGRAAVARYLPYRTAADGFRRWSRTGLREIAREAAQEAVEEVAIAAGAQALQGRWDADRVRVAAVAGGVGGAAGSVLFGGRYFGYGTRFLGRPLRDGGGSVPRRMLAGAVQNPPVSALGGWVATGFDGGLAGLAYRFLGGFAGAAVVGGVRGGGALAAGRLGTRLSPPATAPADPVHSGLLGTDPLPERFQHHPATYRLTAADLAELELQLGRPFRELADLNPGTSTGTAPGDRERARWWQEVRDGAARLGLRPDPDTLVGAVDRLAVPGPDPERWPDELVTGLREALATTTGDPPDRVGELIAGHARETRAELGLISRLREVLGERPDSWQELTAPGRPRTPDELAGLATRLSRELADPVAARAAVELVDRIGAGAARQQELLVGLLEQGLPGRLAGYVAAAHRHHALATLAGPPAPAGTGATPDPTAGDAPDPAAIRTALDPAGTGGAGDPASTDQTPDPTGTDQTPDPTGTSGSLDAPNTSGAPGAAAVAGEITAAARREAVALADRVADIRWELADRWVRRRVPAADRELLGYAAGRPLEPLGLPPRRWHMLRRAGGVAGAIGFGAALAGPAGWPVAAAAAAVAAGAPVVSGIAGRAYDATVRVTELHRSTPDRGQALRRRLPPAVPPLLAGGFGHPVAALAAPLREGLRGWRDVCAARTWQASHAGYAARMLHRGRLPAEQVEPAMAALDRFAGRVEAALAGQVYALAEAGRTEPTAAERDGLRDLWLELADLADAVEGLARERHRRERAQRPADRLRRRRPDGLPSGWRHQRRRAPTGLLPTAADRLLVELAGAPPGAGPTVDAAGGQTLALGEKWHAARRYRMESGFEAAVVSHRIREVQAAVRRRLDGIPEPAGLHRPRRAPGRWPVHPRRGMPDYAAHALRAHTAAAGRVAGYLALAGLSLLPVTAALPVALAWLIPPLPLASVLIGGGSAVAVSLGTKLVDWRYREVKQRAAVRLRQAHRFRTAVGDEVDLPSLAGAAADLRAQLPTVD